MMYDFEGDTENGELVLKEGEVLTITNKVSCVMCVCVCVCWAIVAINTIEDINSTFVGI